MSSPGSEPPADALDHLSGRFFGMLGFGLYGSRTGRPGRSRIVLELSFNRRKLSLGRLGGRLGRSFNSPPLRLPSPAEAAEPAKQYRQRQDLQQSADPRRHPLGQSQHRLFSSFGSCPASSAACFSASSASSSRSIAPRSASGSTLEQQLPEAHPAR